MTTAKELAVRPAAVASLPQRPVALPPILTEVRRTDGFRNPMWGMRKLIPGEKNIVERTLLELEQRDVPASANAIRFHVGKTLNHWDNNRLAGADKELIIADYEYAMRDFSVGQIAEACAEWVSESRFKPVPADLVSLARNIAARDRESVRRSRVLLGLEEPRRWEVLPSPPEKTIARPTVGLLASLTQRLTAPAARKSAQPTSKAELLGSRDPDAVQKLAALRKTEEKAAS